MENLLKKFKNLSISDKNLVSNRKKTKKQSVVVKHQCDVCFKIFSKSYFLKKHYFNNHKTCVVCKKLFKTRYMLRCHIQESQC